GRSRADPQCRENLGRSRLGADHACHHPRRHSRRRVYRDRGRRGGVCVGVPGDDVHLSRLPLEGSAAAAASHVPHRCDGDDADRMRVRGRLCNGIEPDAGEDHGVFPRDLEQQIRHSVPDQHPAIDPRHAARHGTVDPDRNADPAACHGELRRRPRAFRHDHDAEPRHWALPSAGRVDPVRRLRGRQGLHRRGHEEDLAVLRRDVRGADAGHLRSVAVALAAEGGVAVAAILRRLLTVSTARSCATRPCRPAQGMDKPAQSPIFWRQRRHAGSQRHMVDVAAGTTSARANTELRTLTLISIAHWVSHYYILVLPMLYPFLKGRLGVDFIALGLSMSVFGVVSGFTQVPVGYIVDHFGARRVLIIGLMLGSASFVLLGLNLSYTWLIVCGALLGLANSVYHPSDYALLAANIDGSRIGRAFSIHTFAGFFGGAVAPATVAALVALVGGEGALIASGAVGLIAAPLLIAIPIPEASATTASAADGNRGGRANVW